MADTCRVQRAQDLLTAMRGSHGPRKPHKSRHAYALRGLLFCGVCDLTYRPDEDPAIRAEVRIAPAQRW